MLAGFKLEIAKMRSEGATQGKKRKRLTAGRIMAGENRSADLKWQSLRRRMYQWGAVRPKHRKNFRDLAPEAQDRLRDVLLAEIVRPGDAVDLAEHLTGRLHDDRYSVVPWIDAAFSLDGADVLEIGSGTGASTVALGEQGARITGIDVDAPSLKVAKARCAAYGIPAELHCANATEAATVVSKGTFDIVVFFAVLEHMTLEERIDSIRSTWALTRPGGIWCVVETPNRLWYFDGHTSFENFYHWLPDPLAKTWGARSRRQIFSSALTGDSEIDDVSFARWGRGASFHEFDIALGQARDLDVVSNKQDFLRARNPALFAYSLASRARRYERFLEALQPDIDAGFFRQYLDLAIRKT